MKYEVEVQDRKQRSSKAALCQLPLIPSPHTGSRLRCGGRFIPHAAQVETTALGSQSDALPRVMLFSSMKESCLAPVTTRRLSVDIYVQHVNELRASAVTTTW